MRGMLNNHASEFGPFEGRIWFNCAHQGPMPRVAVTALHAAVQRKVNPHLIKDDDFTQVPLALKASLGQLLGVSANDIILGNSTSYGLHLLRNGIRWRIGDEILLHQGDFPATIYPWLGLEQCGVRIRLLKSHEQSLTADELRSEITSSTRMFCVSWVNSFTGSVLDLDSMGQICRERSVLFVVNGSQGVGALKLDVGSLPIDALVCCGYKWLCGPYGTGFCWIEPRVREQLRL